jgi:hypothetical protein
MLQKFISIQSIISHLSDSTYFALSLSVHSLQSVLARPEPVLSHRVWEIIFSVVDYVWNVMAHAQKPDFVFRRNGRVHLNRRGLQFSRLLSAEVCTSAVVMLDTPCSEVVWSVLATHSIRHFPLHFPSRASPCAITFQLDSKTSGLYFGVIGARSCSLPTKSRLKIQIL